jgi:hypothetical protein
MILRHDSIHNWPSDICSATVKCPQDGEGLLGWASVKYGALTIGPAQLKWDLGDDQYPAALKMPRWLSRVLLLMIHSAQLGEMTTHKHSILQTLTPQQRPHVIGTQVK